MAFRDEFVNAAQAAADLSGGQHRAGNIVELDAAQQTAALAQAREQLKVVVGLWGEQTQWLTEAALPPVLAQEVALDTLKQRAMTRRLDVEAARQQVALVDAAVLVVRSNRMVGSVEVGVSATRDVEGCFFSRYFISLFSRFFTWLRGSFPALTPQVIYSWKVR